ncbi:MAG: ABC transporter substrate-binding protein [Candidatus Paceibacterota bacterium]
MSKIKNLYTRQVVNFNKIFRSFNLTEKIIFTILALILIWASFNLFGRVNSQFTTKVPARGGSLTEGIIGSPRFINPLLELSDADRDLTYLIYSGLMRATPTGDLVPDLAESYTISEDGLTYNFKIKSDAVFHDGAKITADDIVYTINMVQDNTLRSPKKNNWIDVTVHKVSDMEVSFELKQPYSPFLENTTLGILPKHIWSSANTEEFPFSPYNTEPIGSGSYEVEKINRNSSGIPNYYELKAFDDYTLGKAYIDNIKFNFYPNEKSLTEAFTAGKIESTSVLSPQSLDALDKKVELEQEQISLPRVFGVFFNQNQAKVFLNKEVRQALDLTVDRDRIVSEVLGDYGQKITGPLPNGILSENIATTTYNRDEAIEQAKSILVKAGWKYNEEGQVWEKKKAKTETEKLAFSIATANTNDLKKTAEILKEDWGRLGVPVEVQTFDPTDLNQTVIAQRKYDALLFGEIINRSLDLFAFWHSSQRNTGYNVAMYTNSKVDTLLESARQISNKDERLKKYAQVVSEIKNDLPAVFIYSPEFVYVLPTKIQGFESGFINNRSERFESVHQWYIETDRVWNFII